MSIDLLQLVEYVMLPTLKDLHMHSKASESLMLGTCAVESDFGTYIHQIGGGPALGPFEMEPTTHDSLWTHYIHNRSGLRDTIMNICNLSSYPDASLMMFDLRYATVMARIKYWPVPEKLPEANDIKGQARYWKKYYNTAGGKGTTSKFISKYTQYIEEYG